METSRTFRRRAMLVGAVLAALPARTLTAAPATWTGDSADPNPGSPTLWSDANSWNRNGIPDTLPVDGDDLTFGLGTVGIIDLEANRSVSSLTFNNSFTLGVATTPLTLTNSTNAVSVVPTVTATLNAVYAGTAGLTLTGGGTLVLNRTGNTFTGNVVVDGSTLAVVGSGGADQTSLGATAKSVTLQNGATLSLIGTADFNPSGTTKSVVIGTGTNTLHVSTGRTMQFDDAGQFSGTGNLVKTGDGTLYFNSQAYTYTGTTIDVNGGTLRVQNAGSLGAANPTITVASGAAFELRATLSGTKPLVLGGTGFSGSGAMYAGSTFTGVANGAVTLTSNTSLGGDGTLTLSGAISDGGSNYSVTKVGTGLLVLSNAGNTWGGATVINGGALRATLPGSNLTISGGVLEPSVDFTRALGAGAGQVQLPSGASGFSAFGAPVNVNLGGAGATVVWGADAAFSPASLVLNASTANNTVTFVNPIDLNGATRTFAGNSQTQIGTLGGAITGTGGITIAGANGGLIALGSTANTYSGATTVNSGILVLSSTSNLPAGTTLSFPSGGGLGIAGTSISNLTDLAAFGAPSFGTSGARAFYVGEAAHTFTIPSAVAATTFYKSGAGTLALTGGTTITSTLTMNGGSLNINQAADVTISNATMINGTGGTINMTGGGRLIYGTAATDIGIGSGGTLTINAVIHSNTAIALDFFNSGGGTVILTGANTYTGATNVQNAVLSVDTLNSVVGGTSSSNLGAPTTVATGTIGIGTTTTAAQLRYTGTGETTDRVINLNGTTGGATLNHSGTGLLRFTSNFTTTGGGSKTLTLTGSTAGVGQIDGSIPNNSGTNITSVTKTGTGTWVLAGNIAYTGTTTINGANGVLVLSGNNTAATGATTITAGALRVGSSTNFTGGTLTLNGGILDLRNDASTNFTKAAVLGASSTINVDRAEGGVGVNQTHTSGAITQSSAAARTLTITGGNVYSLVIPSFGLSPGTGQTTTVIANVDTTINAVNNPMSGFTTTNFDTLVLDGTSTGSVLAGSLADATGGSFALGGYSRITKQGTGTWTLGASNTYTGQTFINGGTLRLGVNQTMSNGIFWGSTNTTTTTGTLDLSTASASFSTMTVQTNTANIGGLTIGSGRTLTVTGNVAIGSGAGANTVTHIAASGAGTFAVNNTAASGSFIVGGSSGTSAVGNTASADFSALATMTVNLPGATSVVTVNPNITTGTTNVVGKFSVLKLAQNTTLTAATLNIGVGPTYNGDASQQNLVVLGSGVNELNVNTINMGTNRDFGSMLFQTPTGTVKIRAQDGVGRAAFNLGYNGAGSTTGVAFTTVNNTFDTTGHAADLLLGATVIGTQNRGIRYDNFFNFDQGTLDMTSLTMATRSAESANGAGLPRITNSTMNIGGGSAVIQSGILQMGQITGTGYSVVAQPHTMNATINVTGGSLLVKSPGINMAAIAVTGANTADLVANGTINALGGVTTVEGNITRGAISGTTSGVLAVNATVNVNGGELNMSGNSIGSATQAVTTVFSAGTIRNLGELNGGGAFIKVSASQLLMHGLNTHTGTTSITAGTLLVQGTHTGGDNYAISSGGTLGGVGTITLAAGKTVTASGTLATPAVLAPGASIGQLNVSSTGGSVVFGDHSTFLVETAASGVNDVLSITGTGATINLTSTSNTLALISTNPGTFTVATFPGYAPGSNQFEAVLMNGFTASFGPLGSGADVEIAYNPTDITLTVNNVVPEPASVGLLALAGVGLLTRRRRTR